MTREVQRTLRECPALAAWEAPLRRELARNLTPRRAQAGDVFETEWAIVAAGAFDVVIAEGGVDLAVDRCRAGDVVGATRWLGGAPVRVRAVSDGTLLEWRGEAPSEGPLAEGLREFGVAHVRRAQLLQVLPELVGSNDVDGLARVASRMTWHHLSRGEVLFKERDVGDAWYVVIGGRVAIRKLEPDGSDRLLRELGRGQAFGEVALVSRRPRSATAVATREATVARLAREDFDALCEDQPTFRRAVLGHLVDHLLDTTRRPEDPEVRVIAVVAATSASPVDDVADGFVAELAHLGGTRSIHPRDVAELGFGADAEAADLRHVGWARAPGWLEARAAEHRFLVLRAGARDSTWRRFVIGSADRVIVVARPDDPLRSYVAEGQPAALVLVHPARTVRPTGTRRWLDEAGFDTVWHAREGSRADVARAARLATRHGVVLALSGGAAKGIAHLGVIEVLRRKGVPIDAVAGVSMGAIVGGLYAMCDDPAHTRRVLRRGCLQRPFHAPTIPIVSLVSASRIRRIHERSFEGVSIEDGWLPFASWSASLTTHRLIRHDRGPYLDAIQATIALPGILPPETRDGEVLVDGGVLANLPVELARERWGGTVIGVDVSPLVPLRARGSRLSPWRILRRLAQGKLPDADEPLLPTVVLHTLVLGSNAACARARRDADLLIEPATEAINPAAFGSFDAIVPLGEHAAEAALRDWLATDAPDVVRRRGA